jgi:hypothetical protein
MCTCREATASDEYKLRKQKAEELANKVMVDEAEALGIGVLEAIVSHLDASVERSINAQRSYLNVLTENLGYAQAAQADVVR